CPVPGDTGLTGPRAPARAADEVTSAAGARRVEGERSMTFLLPSADGVADEVARRLPRATVARYEDGGHDLDEVDFYCLPYMGDGPSVDMIAKLPKLRVLQSLSSGVDNLL